MIKVFLGDITKIHADAIVNAANEDLRRGGGVCGAIFAAAGERELTAACTEVGRCPTGSCRHTLAFNLPAAYIIHAVGPIWDEKNTDWCKYMLKLTYRSILEMASSLGCSSVAIPAISCGIYGFPVSDGARIATSVARGHRKLYLNPVDIFFVCYDEDVAEIYLEELRRTV